jgi:opacity protein-like surface antigen
MMKRNIAASVVIAALFTAAHAAAAQPTCAGDFRATCLVRPHRLITGVHTYVHRIHWRTWNRSTALGFGQIVESGGATYPGFRKPAKIRLRLPAECNGRNWFWLMTINFGHRFGRHYLRNYDYTPC